MMQVQEKRYYTPEEYLKLEVNSSVRHEYIDGEIIPMTGGTPNHNRIAGNFYAALNFALKGKPPEIKTTSSLYEAQAETGLSLSTFPSQCPYSLENVLEARFLPGDKLAEEPPAATT